MITSKFLEMFYSVFTPYSGVLHSEKIQKILGFEENSATSLNYTFLDFSPLCVSYSNTTSSKEEGPKNFGCYFKLLWVELVHIRAKPKRFKIEFGFSLIHQVRIPVCRFQPERLRLFKFYSLQIKITSHNQSSLDPILSRIQSFFEP